MSSSSRVRLTRHSTRETTYGVAPAAAAMLIVRRTGGTFGVDTSAQASDEVRSDLQITDVFRMDQTAKGQIDDEWVHGVHNLELEDSMGSVFSALVSVSRTDISASSVDNSFNTVAGDFVALGVVAGMMLNQAGLVSGNNAGRFRVVTVTATKIVTNKTLTTEAAGATVTMAGKYLRQGVTRHSVAFEELYADVSGTEFWRYLGACSTGFTWQFDHPGKMNVSFTYEIATGAVSGATMGNGTNTAYATNPVMNSADHWRAASEGGTLMTSIRVKSLSFNHQSPKRGIYAAGTLGRVDMGMNTFALTGSLQVYNNAAGRALASKHLAFTQTSLEWETTDALSQTTHFYLPAMYYTGGAPAAGPKDSDVYITLPFTCKMGSDISSMLQLSVFA